VPLTDRAVRNAKALDRPQRLFDGEGMYLEVSPSGGKWWRLKYRFSGKEKRLSLGVYPETSIADARERRGDMRKLLARGIDPGEHRKAVKREAKTRAANSFEAVAREWYEKQVHTWVASHAADVLRRMEKNLFPEIGDKPIGEITPPVLLGAVRKIEHRGAHDLAHRVLQVASQIFRYGVAAGLCERDPAPDLRGALTPHKSRNQAAVTPDELPSLLRAIEGYSDVEDKVTSCALQLLALTFVRTNELVNATWEEFDLKNGMWVIPGERMKMKVDHIVGRTCGPTGGAQATARGVGRDHARPSARALATGTW